MPDDLQHAAAAMAVAFVQQHFADTPEQAARVYFDSLDALSVESDWRAKEKADQRANQLRGSPG